VHRRDVGKVLTAMRPRAAGGAVLALERTFALEDPEGTVTPMSPVWDDAMIRMNDGGADPYGRFYCGTMHYDELTGFGSLYRLDPDGAITKVFDGVTISNGLEWSPDGSLAFYNDTPTHQISVFDHSLEEGLTNRRTFVDLADEGGFPDGLTVDAEGGVWVALWQNGQVRRYAPDGRLDEIVEVDASQTTACTFGGDDLSTLFISTSRRGVTDEPAAGAIFSYVPGVQGQPARTYAG
jgi:sugar lactone lactonase YvrE